jgi:putative hemolysin
MSAILWEIVVILALLILNGILAMTEIAVVSSRKSRLKRLAEEGNRRAARVLALTESPTRFLSTVQIGITLVGILAGAFGGATLAAAISKTLSTIPGLTPYSQALGLAAVVLFITYLSLVIGELLPKRIGMSNPERVAMFMARPMHRLAKLAGPVVTCLTVSTDALLRLLPVRPEKGGAISDDEVKLLMQEGFRAGAFNRVESDMVAGVLDLDLLKVRDIMTPRTKIMWLNADEPHAAVWHKIVVSNHSCFPVYEGNRDRVAGIVSVKAIYANLAADAGVRLRDLITRPLIVPETQPASRLLETFKQTRNHVALATDEFGSIVGLITLHDVMEAIMGDMPSLDERAEPEARRRPDGSWLIDAMIGAEALEEALPGIRFGNEQNRDYQTLAGFVVKTLGHVPKEGETFESQGYVFEVLDMDRHRVDKVLVISARQEPDGSPPATSG